MPTRLGHDQKGSYYRWGNQKKYYFTDAKSKALAKKKADKQGEAIHISEGKGRAKEEVQSVLFPIDKWTQDAAELWLKAHGFKTEFHGKHVRETKHFYRYRQFAPKEGHRMRIKKLPNAQGIEFVLMF